MYDITNFVQNHPGGDKILLAAGGPIDPYWNIYQQHLTPETLEILEELRIGNLDKRDIMIIEFKVLSYHTMILSHLSQKCISMNTIFHLKKLI